MRQIERMKPFLEKIEEVWKDVPDLRFGQLMYNFFQEVGDPFYWEEDVFIEKFKEYMDKQKENYVNKIE